MYYAQIMVSKGIIGSYLCNSLNLQSYKIQHDSAGEICIFHWKAKFSGNNEFAAGKYRFLLWNRWVIRGKYFCACFNRNLVLVWDLQSSICFDLVRVESSISFWVLIVTFNNQHPAIGSWLFRRGSEIGKKKISTYVCVGDYEHL